MEKIEEGIYLKDSGKTGNTTTIMVGVHGNEKSGIDAMNNLKDKLKIISGKVYFIYANLKAIEQNVRFTEKNLNRCFLENISGPSYEEKRAKQIIKYLKQSDFLLDIHNTISLNNSLEVLITEHIEFAKYFPVKKVITNIDSVEKGGSDGYMDKVGGKGFCIECGSINFGDKKRAKELAKVSILNFLKITKNIEGQVEEFTDKKEIIKMEYNYKTKTDDFKLAREFKDFEEIKKGELIGIDGGEKIYAKFDSIIIFAHNRNKKGQEAFYIARKLQGNN